MVKLKTIQHCTVRRWDNLLAPSAAHIQASTKLFTHDSRFSWSADSLTRVPPISTPELLFLGRSNVGKSSLLNTLLNRRQNTLARTSKTAGRTRCLNAYALREVTLVDSPGYGHASRQEWGDLILQYMTHRKTLRRVMVLVEARHGFKVTDEQLIFDLGRKGVPFQVILTKVDKLTQIETDEVLRDAETFVRKVGKAAVWGEVIGVSSTQAKDGKYIGLDELRCSMAYAAGLLVPQYMDVNVESRTKDQPAKYTGGLIGKETDEKEGSTVDTDVTLSDTSASTKSAGNEPERTGKLNHLVPEKYCGPLSRPVTNIGR